MKEMEKGWGENQSRGKRRKKKEDSLKRYLWGHRENYKGMYPF